MNLLKQIKESGIIGAGGAGFPTHAKLTSKADYILMNGAECEPLLRVDQQLMELLPDEIILGFAAAGKLVEAREALIGIKGKHGKVIAILNERIQALGLADFVKVCPLRDMYPAGDEQVLVYELTGRVVPEAGIPINVGCVVINSETALNIYNASQGKPVTEKYITLAGDIPNRVTVKVPVGTPIIDVLRLSGIEEFSDYTVIDGGPMMGPLMKDLGGYITKKNKGFVILKKDHFLIKKKGVQPEQAYRVNRATCAQCRMCTDMCPRYLLGHNMQPHKMMRAIAYSPNSCEGKELALLCSQCGLCEYFSCPVGLHPKMANIHYRTMLAQEKVRYTPDKTEFEARRAREWRLVPSKRLVSRLGLKEFDCAAPMTESNIVPEVVRIVTQQHVGAPAIPVVKQGDSVWEGQLIGAIPENSLGAAIHSSIAGTVTEVTDGYVEIRRN